MSSNNTTSGENGTNRLPARNIALIPNAVGAFNESTFDRFQNNVSELPSHRRSTQAFSEPPRSDSGLGSIQRGLGRGSRPSSTEPIQRLLNGAGANRPGSAMSIESIETPEALNGFRRINQNINNELNSGNVTAAETHTHTMEGLMRMMLEENRRRDSYMEALIRRLEIPPQHDRVATAHSVRKFSKMA